MTHFNRRIINYDDFLTAVCRAPCRTVSGNARPSEDEASYRYDIQLTELIQRPVYPVWFVNRERTEFRKYDHPEARPIRVEELAALHQLVCRKLNPWYRSDEGSIIRASVIILHCAGCNRRVLVDGVHRVLWLLRYGALTTQINVTELSGSQWPVGTPDLNVICTCNRK